jgi:hypothetical protein
MKIKPIIEYNTAWRKDAFIYRKNERSTIMAVTYFLENGVQHSRTLQWVWRNNQFHLYT